VSSYLLRHLS